MDGVDCFMPSVLLVEDNLELAESVRDFLEPQGFLVWHAVNGLDGLRQLEQNPDVLLLDVMLPHKSGLEVLKHLRQQSETPVLLLTARNDEREILEGFALGADDYITKPFRLPQLLARLQAVLRRNKSLTTHFRTKAGLCFLLEIRKVTLHNQTLDLTAAEYDLLLRLAQQPNKIFSRAELVGLERDSLERTVDSHIKNLRRKLGKDHRLETVFGLGYRYAD